MTLPAPRIPCVGDPPAAGGVGASLCFRRERNQIGMFGKYRHWQGGCQGPATSQSARTVWAGHAEKLGENGEPRGSWTRLLSCVGSCCSVSSCPRSLRRWQGLVRGQRGMFPSGVGRWAGSPLCRAEFPNLSLLRGGRRWVGMGGAPGTSAKSYKAPRCSRLCSAGPWARGHGCASRVRGGARALSRARHCACCPAHRAEPRLGFRGCNRKAEIRDSRAGRACPFRAETEQSSAPSVSLPGR